MRRTQEHIEHYRRLGALLLQRQLRRHAVRLAAGDGGYTRDLLSPDEIRSSLGLKRSGATTKSPAFLEELGVPPLEDIEAALSEHAKILQRWLGEQGDV